MMVTLSKGETKNLGKTPREALVAARELIADPKSWCQGYWGNDGLHCMTAALSRSTSYNIAVWHEALGFLCEAADELGRLPDQTLPQWNDTHSHAEVLAAYDRAIAKATALKPPVMAAEG